MKLGTATIRSRMRSRLGVGATLLALLALSWPGSAEAAKRCKAKVASDGTIQVSFEGVTGTPLWGFEAGQETNPFPNVLECVKPKRKEATNCAIAPEGTLAAKIPPEECTVYVADDGAKTCSAWIKTCTPGVRTTGEGAVKAWARVASDGSVVSCYQCDPAQSGRTAKGSYEVDFSPASADITGWPRLGTLDSLGFATTDGQVTLADKAGETSKVVVETADFEGSSKDRSFTVMLY